MSVGEVSAHDYTSELEHLPGLAETAGVHQKILTQLTRPLIVKQCGNLSRHGNPIFNAFTTACTLLGTRASDALAKTEIEASAYPSSQLTSAFIDLVNSSVRGPSKKIYSESVSLGDNPPQDDHCYRACALAEVRFLEAAEKWLSMSPSTPNPSRLVLGKSGVQLFFAKNIDERTALSLRPTVVNGIQFPIGMIFGINLDHHAPVATISKAGGGQKLDLCKVPNILELKPLRMSLFGLPLSERITLASMQRNRDEKTGREYRPEVGLERILDLLSLTDSKIPGIELQYAQIA